MTMRLPFAALLLSLSLATHAETSAMNTPLLDAARHGDAPAVRQLLDRGALPDTRNDQGQTALLVATHANQVEVAKVLIEAGVDVDHLNRLHWTALLEAVILGDGGPRYVEIVRRLLAAGADPRITDKEGVTALEHARQRGYREVVTLLEQWNLAPRQAIGP